MVCVLVLVAWLFGWLVVVAGKVRVVVGVAEATCASRKAKVCHVQR